MKAIIYISTCLLVNFSLNAQEQDSNTERPDSTPPAVTVAEVEKNVQEAAIKRKEYNEKESPKLASEKKDKNKESDNRTVVVTTSEKVSKKPEKQ